MIFYFFFFQAEDGIRDYKVTGVQTCALPIFRRLADHDGGHAGHGGKRGEQVWGVHPLADEDGALEQRIAAQGVEVVGRLGVANEKLEAIRDEEQREWRLAPARPHLLADLAR